jgi:hypothetical protein
MSAIGAPQQMYLPWGEILSPMVQYFKRLSGER